LSVRGRAGDDRFRVRTRGLAPGAYIAVITARDALGLSSRAMRVRSVILAAR
jgi:hypothetical protein